MIFIVYGRFTNLANKNIYLNLIANILSFVISTIISFLLTSFIVSNISAEAYGMINLSNSLINYISIISISLNSMAIRYISIHTYRNEIKKANGYFSSIILSNLLLSLIALIVFLPLIFNINSFINISDNLVTDVKQLFLLMLINFILNLFVSVYSISMYIENKLYLNSFRQVQSVLLKGIILIILFFIFKPKLMFVGIATCIASLFNLLWNLFYTKKLTPYFNFKIYQCKIRYAVNLLKSGIWNSVSKLGNVIDDSISLLICNILLGESLMGLLSVSKTIPQLIFSILGTITTTFFPTLTKDYSLGHTKQFLRDMNQSIKTLGLLLNIPIVGFIVFCHDFFELWTPSLSASELSTLSIFSILPLCLTGATACIYDIFTITKKLKYNSIVVLLNAITNCIITFILINVFHLGVISVVMVPCITSYIKNLLFTFPYAAKCLEIKWNFFYKTAIKNMIVCFIEIIILSFFNKYIFITNNWISFFISILIAAIMLLFMNLFFFFSKKDRMFLLIRIKNKVKNLWR